MFSYFLLAINVQGNLLTLRKDWAHVRRPWFVLCVTLGKLPGWEVFVPAFLR